MCDQTLVNICSPYVIIFHNKVINTSYLFILLKFVICHHWITPTSDFVSCYCFWVVVKSGKLITLLSNKNKKELKSSNKYNERLVIIKIFQQLMVFNALNEKNNKIIRFLNIVWLWSLRNRGTEERVHYFKDFFLWNSWLQANKNLSELLV